MDVKKPLDLSEEQRIFLMALPENQSEYAQKLVDEANEAGFVNFMNMLSTDEREFLCGLAGNLQDYAQTMVDSGNLNSFLNFKEEMEHVEG